MKLLTTILSTTIVFTGLYLYLFLNNLLLRNIDQTQQNIKNHTTYTTKTKDMQKIMDANEKFIKGLMEGK